MEECDNLMRAYYALKDKEAKETPSKDDIAQINHGILRYPAPVMLNMVVGFYGGDKFVGAGYLSIP